MVGCNCKVIDITRFFYCTIFWERNTKKNTIHCIFLLKVTNVQKKNYNCI